MTDAVAKFHFRMVLDVFLKLIPLSFVISDILTIGTDCEIQGHL